MRHSRPTCHMCQRSGLSEFVSSVAKTQTRALSPLRWASACGNCHCCPTCSSMITGGRRRSIEIALNIAKCAVGHLNMETTDGHRCNVLLEKSWGCQGMESPWAWDCFLLLFLCISSSACFCLPCALLQGRARFSSICASNQNQISSGASRHCLLKAVMVAGYQVLIPASHASLSANHGQGYPHFLAFTGKPVCSLGGESSCWVVQVMFPLIRADHVLAGFPLAISLCGTIPHTQRAHATFASCNAPTAAVQPLLSICEAL